MALNNKTIATMVTVAIALCVGSWIFEHQRNERSSTTSNSPDSDRGEEQADQRNDAPTSVENVQKMIIGAWTYTGEDVESDRGKIWQKLVFEPDGTMKDYRAASQDKDWGKPTVKKWHAVSETYSNTGQRWYGVRVDGWPYPIIMKGEGLLKSEVYDVEFKRGNEFPFSK